MSSVHVARQGFITKSALPSVSRVRGTTPVADKDTVLLLNGNGTNGAQNNTFIDGSTNNFTITRNGNTTQGTFSPFSQAAGEWSNFFDGTGDFLNFTDTSNDLDLGGIQASMEVWVYPQANATAAQIITKAGSTTNWSTSTGFEWQLNIANGTLQFSYNNGAGAVPPTFGVTIITGGTVNLNEWTHVLVATDTSNNISLYKNGVRVGTGTNAITKPTTRTNIRIGNDLSGNTFTGYISNIRFVAGANAQDPTQTSLTVPTTGLTAVSGTELLTCQDNRFIDNSTNAFAITRNGDVRVTSFSPFAPTAAYDAGTNGGSGYFDGTGDYLTVPDSTAFDLPGDFTLEAWTYGVGSNGFAISVGSDQSGQNGFSFYNDSPNSIGFFSNNTVIASATPSLAQTTGQWRHLAVVRSGSSLKIYVNGNEVASATNTTSFTGVAANGVSIGAAYQGSYSVRNNGYIGDVRLVKGTAVYTSNFTPPTAPLTAITNTSLLLNFTNAGIIDSAMGNVIETVGNAQIDTGTKKFGSGSLEFDGTGDYLVMGGGQADNFLFGTGDFTIEFWLNPNSIANNPMVIDFRPASTTGNYVTLYVLSTGALRFDTNGTNRISGGTVSTSTWQHIALCRSGTSTRAFINGTQVGSTYTDSTNYLSVTARPFIGADSRTVGDNPLNGFIDDLRITKGVARYTANFTPPTSELVVYGNVDNVVNNNVYGVYQLA